MRFSTTTASAIVAALAAQTASASEEVSITGLSIRKHGSPVGDKFPSANFTLNAANAKDLDCSATDFSFPEPTGILPCGDSDYSFVFLPGSAGVEFSIMVYHNVGDSHADLRGGDDVPTKCVSEGSPADVLCTQQGDAVTFVIDGPVSPRRSRQ